MIISTGMRTDIPAFYSKWFISRIKEGFVYVRNPYNEHQVTKYILSPDVVDCLCFCTKNPAPILPHFDEIKKFNQFWFVTITAYSKDFEPNVPEKIKVISSFKELSEKVSANAVGWRYDPIFYGKGYDKQKHIESFSKIAEELDGYTNLCVISFLDLYEKVKRNEPDIYPPSKNEQVELVKELVKIANSHGMELRTCCEDVHLASVGANVSGCQTQDVIERAIGKKLSVPKKNNVRKICSCLLGNDIGAYNTCIYANIAMPIWTSLRL